MKKNKGIWVVLVLALTAMDFGCSKPVEEKLTSQQIYWLDTVFYRIQDSLDIELDSICLLRKDQYVKFASDSIRRVRIEEIEKMLGKK